jgi:ArsR family transcriptional regulator
MTKHIDMNRNYLRAVPKEWRNLSRVFTALGDEHRQRILLTFSRAERLNVGSIVEVSTLSRTTVSHHLKVLREAGVLRSEKAGKEVWYWIDKGFLLGALGAVHDYIRKNS